MPRLRSSAQSWSTEMTATSNSGDPRRPGRDALDWYSLLGIPRDAPEDIIAGAIERLSRQASALATTAPERSQTLRETVRSMRRDLMTGTEARSLYDRTLISTSGPQPPATGPPPVAPTTANPSPTGSLAAVVPPALLPLAKRFRQFLQTGWTCPLCGADGLPGDRFCTSCGAAMHESTGNVNRPHDEPPSCQTCHEAIQSDDLFCTRCGTRLR
jgi:hypothetical protein